MKYNEFHRWLRQQSKKSERGWFWTGKAEGSHYIYEDKDGIRYPVPNHGAKEVPEGLRKRILKDMGF
ncbi:MAG TPA: type II toxin-antitoxin system HicA family toxin [Paludibacter sp.]|nr:type II toxin-antitoxin system HicA family toxin [Paludibacter sp.]